MYFINYPLLRILSYLPNVKLGDVIPISRDPTGIPLVSKIQILTKLQIYKSRNDVTPRIYANMSTRLSLHIHLNKTHNSSSYSLITIIRSLPRSAFSSPSNIARRILATISYNYIVKTSINISTQILS